MKEVDHVIDEEPARQRIYIPKHDNQRDDTSIEAQFERLEIGVGFADSRWGWWGRKVEDPLGRIHPLDTTS